MKELEEILKKLEQVGDVIAEREEGKIEIYVQDVEGLDEDYEEIERDYCLPQLVEELEKFLMQQELVKDELYKVYKIEGQLVELGYSSYEI